MSTLTIRLPDDIHARLKAFARHRGASVNKLLEEFSMLESKDGFVILGHKASPRPSTDRCL
jgi:hypothetical protein